MIPARLQELGFRFSFETPDPRLKTCSISLDRLRAGNPRRLLSGMVEYRPLELPLHAA